MKRKLLIAGVICLCLLGTLGLVVRNFITQQPFLVHVDKPSDINVGDEFEMAVAVQNSTAKDHTLSYVFLGDRILKRFELVSYHPKSIKKIEDEGFLTFYIDNQLKAGSSFDLTIQLKAQKAGRTNIGIEVDSSELGLFYFPHNLVVNEPNQPL